MNAFVKSESAVWRDDLAHSGDLNRNQIESYGFFIAWFEPWRASKALKLNRITARVFWKEAVLSKPREPWQTEQWAEAMRWLLHWAKLSEDSGKEIRGMGERMMHAVVTVGSRRGLALTTKRTYGGWAARYGEYVGDAKRALDPANARQFLTGLVERSKVSFSTQKQALNALAFFFKTCADARRLILA